MRFAGPSGFVVRRALVNGVRDGADDFVAASSWLARCVTGWVDSVVPSGLWCGSDSSMRFVAAAVSVEP